MVSWLLLTLLWRATGFSDPLRRGSGKSGNLLWLVALAPFKPSSSYSASRALECLEEPNMWPFLFSSVTLLLQWDQYAWSSYSTSTSPAIYYPLVLLKQAQSSTVNTKTVVAKIPPKILLNINPLPKLSIDSSSCIFCNTENSRPRKLFHIVVWWQTPFVHSTSKTKPLFV